MKRSHFLILAAAFLLVGGGTMTDHGKEVLNAGLFSSNSAEEDSKACHVYGEIEFVEHNGDYEVEFVDHNADLEVEYVDHNADETGEWEVVDHNGDYEIERVDHNGDFTVETVDHNPGCN